MACCFWRPRSRRWPRTSHHTWTIAAILIPLRPPESPSAGRVTAWLHKRVPISAEQLAELTNEPVPNHLKRWWFCLGGTPAYLFVVQIVTGILLAMYYQPSPSTAYESIRYI